MIPHHASRYLIIDIAPLFISSVLRDAAQPFRMHSLLRARAKSFCYNKTFVNCSPGN
jgi:hypothetical protein